VNFKIGDRVRFLNEVGSGRILSIKSGIFIVEDEHGFEREVFETEVVAEKPHLENQYNLPNAELESKRAVDLPKTLAEAEDSEIVEFVSNQGRKTYLEIDLHINELVDKTGHLSNHQMVTIQLDHLIRLLKLAKKSRYSKVVVIHGVGAGVLKSEIRYVLSQTKNCSFCDADYNTYGYGATEVTLWYN